MGAGKVIALGTVAVVGTIVIVKVTKGVNAARVAKNAMLRVVGVKNFKVGLVGIIPTLKFNLQIECTNPTGKTATFDTFAINLQNSEERIGSKVWAQIRHAGPVTMEARELSKIVEIPTTINLGGTALSVLFKPAVQTLFNLFAKKKKDKTTPPTPPAAKQPIQGTELPFVSLEDYEAAVAKRGVGAPNPDEVNLLKNIQNAIPKTLFAVGNVRINTLLISFNEEISLTK